MKLLSTIAAVLISISAFSQDLIEYNESTYSLNGEKVSLEYKKAMTDFNPDAESMFELLSLEGTFSRNGEELSMEQITVLTVLHKAGRGNIRRANTFDRMHKNNDLRLGNNTFYFVGGAATGFFGGFTLIAAGWALGFTPAYEVLPIAAPAAGLCVVSYKAFSRIALSKKGCRRKRDRQFKKVAEKINQAIKAANQ